MQTHWLPPSVTLWFLIFLTFTHTCLLSSVDPIILCSVIQHHPPRFLSHFTRLCGFGNRCASTNMTSLWEVGWGCPWRWCWSFSDAERTQRENREGVLLARAGHSGELVTVKRTVMVTMMLCSFCCLLFLLKMQTIRNSSEDHSRLLQHRFYFSSLTAEIITKKVMVWSLKLSCESDSGPNSAQLSQDGSGFTATVLGLNDNVK